jgi:phosphatidate cytidylyltransferase
MFRKRLIVVIFLVPVIVGLDVIGGWLYSLAISLVLALAAWEFWQMFRKGGYLISPYLLIAGVVLLGLRYYLDFLGVEFVIALLVLVSMSVYVLEFERGMQNAATNFCINMGGILYIGLLGSYFITLRQVNDGLWWFLIVLPAAWFADLGGYFIGRWLGKHRMAPKVSPKKTWEGYVGGILFGLAGTALMAFLWHLRAPEVTVIRGLVIGAVIAVIIPLGDLGESIIKRQFGYKDSSNLIPGHGGILDRIDTWLWSAAIGYYLVIWLTSFS